MLIDSHIHIGQYYHICTSPIDLVQMMDAVGVKQFAVCSTSICEGDYDKVLCEMVKLSDIAQERLHPILWIIPSMLTDGGLERFLKSGIKWECLKIHPQLNPSAWRGSESYLNEVTSLAKSQNLPLLIHTGETEGCYPVLFEQAVADNPTVNFILAHARPLDQAISLMKVYPNVWADTAFVPTGNVIRLCEAGFSNRILWGTDYPITRYYYPETDMKQYYADLLRSLQDSVSPEDYDRITYKNFQSLFHTSNGV